MTTLAGRSFETVTQGAYSAICDRLECSRSWTASLTNSATVRVLLAAGRHRRGVVLHRSSNSNGCHRGDGEEFSDHDHVLSDKGDYASNHLEPSKQLNLEHHTRGAPTMLEHRRPAYADAAVNSSSDSTELGGVSSWNAPRTEKTQLPAAQPTS